MRLQSILCLVILTVTGPVIGLAASVPASQGVVVDAETEIVIKGALKWLASQQGSNGAWFIGTQQNPGHPVAMTGYALIAFMAAGQLPEEGDYAKNVTAGMQFLLDAVGPDGLFQGVPGGEYMYNHGIATIALGELYGQSKSAAARRTLERLVQVIVTTQNKDGGWRYQPQPRDADISVTVLQVVALRAAKNAGLDVPQTTIDNAVAYVRSCCDQASGGFNYQPRARKPGFARTAAAIYSLQVCGQYDDPLVKAGSDYLLKSTDKSYWTYGSYYAAPAEYMIGGESWRQWYSQTKDSLLKTVKRNAGLCHWEASGGGDVGPVYCTAVYTSILATPYHYIPLYQR